MQTGHDAPRYPVEIQHKIKFEVAQQHQAASIYVAGLGSPLVS